MEQELAAGALLDDVDSLGRTSLLWALHANRPDAARLLIERGARGDAGGPADHDDQQRHPPHRPSGCHGHTLLRRGDAALAPRRVELPVS